MFIGLGVVVLLTLVTQVTITIYDTVISSEAGDKVFEPGIFLFREVSRFF